MHPPTVRKNGLASSVRRGALWSLASNLLMRMANIGITAIVARILAPRDFGIFAVATTAYAIVSALGELGVSSCLIRADLNIDTLAPTMVTVSVTTSAAFAAIMIMFAEPIAAALGSAGAAGPIRVMAIAVFLVGLFAVPGAQLARDFKQGKLFLANAISFLPTNAALIILAKFGSGAMAFAWSRVLGQAIVGCCLVAYTERNYWPGLARRALSVLFKFGIPLASANFVNFILLNVDYALIGRLLGPIELGTYVLAFNIASWSSSLLGTVINNVAMPAFSRVRHDTELLRSAISSALRIVSLAVMPVCGMTVVLARPLVLTLYGEKWSASAAVLAVLAIYGATSIICMLFANMLAGLGKSKSLLVVQLFWLAALVPAMVIGVHRDGIVGAAIAHIVVIVPLVLPCYLIALKKTTGIHLLALIADMLPATLAAAAAAAAAWVTSSKAGNPPTQLMVGLAVGGIIYVLAVAPQIMGLLSKSNISSARIRRLFRIYDAVARTLGLPTFNPPRHIKRRHRRRVAL
jgi:PST family polysaccharide transporter